MRAACPAAACLAAALPPLLAAAALSSCAEPPSCGPAVAEVRRVLDGDTIELRDGERVRYLLVDAPELGGEPECFAAAAAQFQRDRVLGQRVTLRYDAECRDRYGRLLAYVARDGADINRALVEGGYACALHIPPNGADRVEEFRSLQAVARAQRRGLWGACAAAPCR
jgi:micrococcal nuclease